MTADAIAVYVYVSLNVLVTTYGTSLPVVIVVVLVGGAVIVCFLDLCLIEVIILSLGCELRNGIHVSGAVLPLAYEVAVCISICNRSKRRNVCSRQGLTKVSVNGNGLDQAAIQTVEVYGVQILLVVDRVVREVSGGEGQSRALGNDGLLCNAVLTNEVNVCVELSGVICERNGNGCLTGGKCGTDQIEAVNSIVVVEVCICRPLEFFTNNGGDCEGDLACSCVCLDVEQRCVIQQNGDCVAGAACANCNLQCNVRIQCSQIKDHCGNDVGSGPTVANLLVNTKLHFEGAAVQGNVTVCTKVCNSGVCCIVIGVCGYLIQCGAVFLVPALEGIAVHKIHLLSGSLGCFGNSVVLHLSGSNQLVACKEVYGCPQISLIGCVSGCGNDCGVPALEGQNVSNCLDPSVFYSGNGAVRNLNGVRLVCYNKGDVSGVVCYVGSVTGNNGQLRAKALPALEVQGIEDVQVSVQRRNGAVCEGLGIQSAEHVEGNGVLIDHLLNGHDGISSGHSQQYVAVCVLCNQRVALGLEIGVVRSELCAVRQEALKYHVALLIYEGNGVQVHNGYAEEYIGGHVTAGNVVAQSDGLTVSDDDYLVKNVLEPCGGVVSNVEAEAEFAVTLVGVGQLSILELLGDQVEYQIDRTVGQVECSLCLSGLGNSVLELSKCADHAYNDRLCTSGADVELVCNASGCCCEKLAANQCVCILELGHSCQVAVSNSLGQVVDRFKGKGCFLAVYGLRNNVDQDLTELLEQSQSRTDLLELSNERLFLRIGYGNVVQEVLHHVCALLIGQQVKQRQQLTNGCGLAKTCNDGLLGLIGNACMVESLGQSLGECAGDQNVHAYVTVQTLCKVVCIVCDINGLEQSLCSVANQCNVATKSNVELDLAVSLTLSAQNHIIGSQNAVIANVCYVGGGDGIGQQSLLQTFYGDQLAVVAGLNRIHKSCKLGNAVALDLDNLVAVYGYVGYLTVVDLGSTCLDERGDRALVCALRVAASDIAKNVSQNLLVVACVNVYVQSSYAVRVNQLVLAVVHGQTVYVSDNLLQDVNGGTLDYDFVSTHGYDHVGVVPLYVLTGNRSALVRGDQLLVAKLLLVNCYAIDLPDNRTGRRNVIGIFFLLLLLFLLVLDGFLDLVKGCTVLNGVNNGVDVTDVLVVYQNVLDHDVKLFLCVVLVLCAENLVCGLFKRFVAFILFIDVILQLLFHSVLVFHVLDAIVLVDQVNERTHILACKRGQERVVCSERGNSDYRNEHCQNQQCDQYSATKFCGLLHWFFLQHIKIFKTRDISNPCRFPDLGALTLLLYRRSSRMPKWA